MPPDVDVLAGVVVQAIKAALAPVRDRLLVAETRLADMAAATQSVGDLRERVLVVETKAAIPPPPVPDLAPLQDRITVLEMNATAIPPTPPVEIAPEDVAASVAGLLRKELADLEIASPKASRRVIRDGQGAVKYEIEDVT